jgi:hypothetical protein
VILPTIHSRWSSAQRAFIGVFYLLFAIVFYLVHGPNPAVNIDHIAYFKLTEQIRAEYPAHDYWRTVTVTRSYAVLLAYVQDWTGDSVRSMKLLLAGLTVAYLFAAEFFFRQVTNHRWIAVLFAVLSALNLSFGPVFWGMTEFYASLNRSIAVPPMLLLLGWYLRNRIKNRRFLVYPALIYLSVLHLSTYYLLAVLAAMDGFRLFYSFVKWNRSPRLLSAYFGAFILVGLAYISLAPFNLSSNILGSLMPAYNEGSTAQRTSNVDLRENANLAAWTRELGSDDAWRLELQAQPWRNFPPPFATLLGAAASIGFVVPLAVLLSWIAIARTGFQEIDRLMLIMTACIGLCAFGLQSSLYIINQLLPIYPINFEEVRAVALFAIPLLYFTLRGFEVLWFGTTTFLRHRILASFAVIIFIWQPVMLVRILPQTMREQIVQKAQNLGILDHYDSQRTVHARQFLNLESDGDRFYYSTLPVLNWLRAHTGPRDRVLTNRDELYLLPATVIGTSNGFLNTASASQKRLAWSVTVQRLSQAFSTRDLDAVLDLAKACDASFIVVPWIVPEAVFSANGLSVLTRPPKSY